MTIVFSNELVQSPVPPSSTGHQPEISAQQRWAVKVDFVDAQPVRPYGLDETPAIVSYFKGAPEDWHAGVPTYSRIMYPELWPGIDLVYKADVNQIKYEFILHAGADPNLIRLKVRGAELTLLPDQDQAGYLKLEIRTPMGSFLDKSPIAYQPVDGQHFPVAASFTLVDESTYGFSLGNYDPGFPLVIDPAYVVYSGYIGGNAMDNGNNIAVDASGAVYLVGITTSSETSFPITVGPDLQSNGNADVFVAKITPDGKNLVYAGFIGGNKDDNGEDIAIDELGNAYITGYTNSTETSFPVLVGPDLTYNGSYNDAFVAKINPSGTALVYAGYIGGAEDDKAWGIAVKKDTGLAFVAGFTDSDQSTFPVLVGPDLSYNGDGDAFITSVNATGSSLFYSGYIGGDDGDQAYEVETDQAGNAYVAGISNSSVTSFPVLVGPFLTKKGIQDLFITKVNPSGTGLVYSGFLGGTEIDRLEDVAVDANGNAYLVGRTTSTESTFPVLVGPDLTHNGSEDGFIAKVNAAGSGLVYAGYIGGNMNDQAFGVAVDGEGNAYVVGSTSSTQDSFPVVAGPDSTYNGPNSDAYIAKVKPDGSALVFCGFIGGENAEGAYNVAVDPQNNAYVTGWTSSPATTFPVIGGPFLTYKGSEDAFVTKIAYSPVPILSYKLAFMSDRDGNWEIYDIDSDGSHSRNLTQNSLTHDATPRFTRHGFWVAYRRVNISTSQPDVAKMLANGGGQVSLTNDTAQDSYPSWSPDSSKITWASERDGDWDIYTMLPDGSGVTQLTKNTTYDSMPEFSPDGTKIVYVCEANGYAQICVMNPDGSGRTNLSNSTRNEYYPSWSPSGTQILYTSYPADNSTSDIYIMNANGTDKKQLTNDPAFDWAAIFSPDGQWIAFSTNRDGNEEVYLMLPDGSGAINLTNSPTSNDRYPCWYKPAIDLFIPLVRRANP